MYEHPLCPNCSQPMTVSRTIPTAGSEPEVNVFKCAYCNVSFITEDHLPIAGVQVH